MGKHIIRTSDRGTFRSCRQLWDWSSKIRQNLEPEQRYAPFEDGTIWHGALEVYYEPKTWHLLDNPSTAIVVHENARLALRKLHAEQVAIAAAFNELSPEQEIDYVERLEMLEGMLEHYFVWAPTVDTFKPVKIEVEFEVPINYEGGLYIDGDPVVYQGRLDGLAQDPQGRYWILEHKTTGQMGDNSWLELDAQCGSYAWAIQRQLGVQIAGILYTQALKAAPKPPKRLVSTRQGRNFSVNKQQRTTFELFSRALEEAGEPITNYKEYLDYLHDEGNPFFRRIEVYRNTAALEYMGRNIKLEAQEMLNDPAIYPSPGMFSCNWCRFKEPCIAKQNGYDYEFILDELFVKRS